MQQEVKKPPTDEVTEAQIIQFFENLSLIYLNHDLPSAPPNSLSGSSTQILQGGTGPTVAQHRPPVNEVSAVA